MFIETV